MDKYDLASQVAKSTGKSLKYDVIPILNAAFNTMAETIISDERVSISALGTFFLKDRPLRRWHNPVRNVPFILPPGKLLKFEPSRSLRSAVRKFYEDEEEILTLPQKELAKP